MAGPRPPPSLLPCPPFLSPAARSVRSCFFVGGCGNESLARHTVPTHVPDNRMAGRVVGRRGGEGGPHIHTHLRATPHRIALHPPIVNRHTSAHNTIYMRREGDKKRQWMSIEKMENKAGPAPSPGPAASQPGRQPVVRPSPLLALALSQESKRERTCYYTSAPPNPAMIIIIISSPPSLPSSRPLYPPPTPTPIVTYRCYSTCAAAPPPASRRTAPSPPVPAPRSPAIGVCVCVGGGGRGYHKVRWVDR